MPINVTEVIQEFIRNLLTDRNFAVQYAQDPAGDARRTGRDRP